MQSDWQRVVIKVGSALIAPNGKKCSAKYVLAIAGFINECRAQNIDVILVSSGSVAAGRRLISHNNQGASIAEKQAMAAVGQSQMMANWQRFFDFSCAQILVTHEDLADRHRYINIKNTISTLLDNGVLPIINENDSVATDELKLGDNDNLGAQVAIVSDAQALIIFSDVDGLFNKDPRKHSDAVLIPKVSKIDKSVYALAGGTTNRHATGGMRTKIQAADIATKNGVDTLIANGTNNDVFELLLTNQPSGTLFSRVSKTQAARKQWLEHTVRTAGTIVIDDGAKRALVERGASLLSKGIIDVTGDFLAGDAVDVVCKSGVNVIARGISEYNNDELTRISGKHSDQIKKTLGYSNTDSVIHRDNLVLI